MVTRTWRLCAWEKSNNITLATTMLSILTHPFYNDDAKDPTTLFTTICRRFKKKYLVRSYSDEAIQDYAIKVAVVTFIGKGILPDSPLG